MTTTLDLTDNGLTVLQTRYLAKGETPSDLFQRVANHIAKAEPTEQREYWSSSFIDLMAACIFMPNSPTLFNAGTGQARSFTAIGECLKALEGSGELKSIPFPEDLRGKYQEFTEADTTQLREAGYQEEFLSLEEGILIYLGMLKENGGFHL